MRYLSPHIWVKQPNVKKPFARPVGYIRRRGKTNATLTGDFMSLRKTLFLCKTCQWRMPMFWRRRYGYWKIPGLWAESCRCTSCQADEMCDIFHPEGGGYLEEHFRAERIEDNARAQQVAVRDGRQIAGQVFCSHPGQLP